MPATHVEAALANGHDSHVHSSPVANKKAKGKRGMDSTEASRLLQARISQLEQDAAGEKDQEMEIGACKIYCDGRNNHPETAWTIKVV